MTTTQHNPKNASCPVNMSGWHTIPACTCQAPWLCRYRRKHCEVEAFQMTQERRRDLTSWPVWLKVALLNGKLRVPDEDPGDRFFVECRFNPKTLNIGDWVFQEWDGVLRVYDDDTFQDVYEPVFDEKDESDVRA